MIKKYILGFVLAAALPFTLAYAATPMFSVSGNGDNTATINVTGGEPNAPVSLFYNSGAGFQQGHSIGTTDANGRFTGTINSSAAGVIGNMPVYVQVAGYQSASTGWPFNSSGGTGTANNGSVMFSQSNPNVTVGQNGTINLSGGSGAYYIASNSNANGVMPSISGNTLTLYGGATGQSNIVVCSTGGGCGTITTSVNSNGSTSGSPSLSQSSLNVSQGGQGSISLSGGGGPYTVSIPTGSGVSTTLIGNTLYVNGNATGTSVINVCSNNSGCTPLSVNVQSQASVNTNTNTGTTGGNTSGLSFTLPLTVGQPLQLSLMGGNGSYYLQSSASGPALASLTGNTLMINGSAAGSGMLSVCQTGTNSCLPINFTVAPSTTVFTGTGGGYLFDSNLLVGVRHQDVAELQTRLAAEGFFHGNVTGYFGPLTREAVRAYQASHGISATGYVGAQTRAMLNQ